MPPRSSSPGGVRGCFKRVGHGVKKVFKPGDQAPTSHTSSPPPGTPAGDSPMRLTASREPDPGLLRPPSARSQRSVIVGQSVPSASQPTPTASYLAADDTKSTREESSLTQAAKKAGADAWSGLKVALQLLKESSDAFPPVKSAVAGFLGVVSIFETAAQNRQNYAEIASNLQGMVDEFKEHPGEHSSSRMSEALAAMASGLKKEMKHVEQRRQRSGLRRHVEAGQDVDDVQGCYRRVETLCRELQNKALVKIWRNQEEQQLVKGLKAALKAMYDSILADVVGRRTCTPGTRQAILAEMRGWADDLNAPKVYWMNGMAGTGKTTLAYSFCAEMQRERRLGASFFCSRTDADSRDVSKIVPTIAHQLARLLPSYREALIRRMDEDQEIGVRRTATQFEKLIRDPLREVTDSVPDGIVVTIDALDECDRRDGVQEILSVLFLHAKDLPIKFLVTCRPEPGLFDTLQSKDPHFRFVLHLHDIEASFVRADIRTYLEAELAETSLPSERLKMLAEQAGTLFIYAATAVRYIHPQNRQVDVHQRLEDLLSIGSKTRTNKHKGIDELYAAVLAVPFADEELNPEEQANIRLVLDTAVCAREPISVGTMAELLELDGEQKVMHALQHLRSVLHVSEGTGLVSTLHASFTDFMLDQERSEDLRCNAVEHNRILALRCFGSMRRLLRFNICELESSFALDENVPGLRTKVDKAVSAELLYASRYWGAHLASTKALNEVDSALGDFLSNRLLFWMEVLNLQKGIGAGSRMLTHVHRWLQSLGGASDVLELVLDASRFVAAFGLSLACRSTPHIYVSALPFWPETRPVSVRYQKRAQGLIRLEGSGMEGRDMSCLAMWDTTGFVLCVAFSPNGTRIVSGSSDSTIHVWDAHSGALVAGPFEGHTDWVWSAAFSSDGTRIVSASHDNTIRVWDARSGDLVAGPFQGHTDAVLSVAFSPDDTCIVSGSADRTIRVWDTHSGDSVGGPFKGHTGFVRSVAYSPDGTRIASGSGDGTIRVWDVRSGDLVAGPFEGHTDTVYSVAFSPDGTRIASGSADKSARVWDALNGDLVAGPFKGHTDEIRSVGFSPDGTRIISGSDDKTIRVWDARNGDLVAGPFEGHNARVYSVAFAPDSSRIMSGSEDKTIRVWDASSGLLSSGRFGGHTDLVKSVAFSPDGTHVVSGSFDKTIRVWEARSGDLVAGPFEGHDSGVLSVRFSPDGTRVVSGGADGSVCVWDVGSGDLVARPFRGHTGWVYSVGFSSDSTRIVSGSFDKTIRVWDARTGDPVAEPFRGHAEPVTSISFSCDGTRIVSGSSDNTIRVWDARTGDLVAAPFRGHTDWVLSVAFSPDSIHIVSGSQDKSIRVWTATPPHVHGDGHLKDWLMDGTGVVTDRQGQLLLSVPVDLWTRVVRPENMALIYAKGVLRLNFDNVLLGERWTQCYEY